MTAEISVFFQSDFKEIEWWWWGYTIFRLLKLQDRCRATLDELLGSSHRQAFVILQQAVREQYPWIVDRMNEVGGDEVHVDEVDSARRDFSARTFSHDRSRSTEWTPCSEYSTDDIHLVSEGRCWRLRSTPDSMWAVAGLKIFYRRGWLWEPDGNWGGLGLRDNFMHLWIRTLA